MLAAERCGVMGLSGKGFGGLGFGPWVLSVTSAIFEFRALGLGFSVQGSCQRCTIY